MKEVLCNKRGVLAVFVDSLKTDDEKALAVKECTPYELLNKYVWGRNNISPHDAELFNDLCLVERELMRRLDGFDVMVRQMRNTLYNVGGISES